MTGDLSPDWDDDRLANAFRARAAARPTPSDLVAAVFDRVQQSPHRSMSWRGFRVFGPMAAAAIAIVVGAVAFVQPAAAPGRGQTIAIDLPILSVTEALATSRADATDREIAVWGYFSPAPTGVRCPASLSAAESPVRLECPFDFQWLLDTPEPLDQIRSTLPPGRSGFQPLLPFLDTSALAVAADHARARGSLPDVVLIGHFHDRRGHETLCDMPDSTVCSGFIADGIFSIGGVRQPPNTIVDMEPWPPEPRREPTWTAGDVDRVLLASLPNLEILSKVALPGNRISQLEPALGTGGLGIIHRRIAWVVNGLDRGAASVVPVRRTFVLVDGTTEAYESAPWEVSDIGFLPFSLVGPSFASSDPATSAPPSPETADASVIGDLLAHPITVTQAIERRDTSLDDTELAVTGFGWVAPNDVPCPNLRVAVPALIQCSATVLLESWRVPIFNGGAVSPALNLLVQPETLGDVSLPSTDPIPVIVLGHFDDHRANSCPRHQLQMCRKEFVVDAIVGASGRSLVRTVDVNHIDPQVRPRLTIDQAIGTMGLNSEDPGILAALAVRPSALSEIEPEIAHAPELQGADIVWIVRWIAPDTAGRPILWTRITSDGDPARLGPRSWDVMGDGLVSTMRNPDAPQPQTATPSVAASGS